MTASPAHHPAARAALSPSPTPPAVAEPVERRTLLAASFDGLATLAAADFDSDGISETVVFATARQMRRAGLAVLGRPARQGAILILGDAGGLFTDPLPLRGRVAPEVAAADFTSDGLTDLVVGGGRRQGLTLLVGNGDGTFDEGVPIPGVSGQVLDLRAADFNGDGRSDLLVTTRGRATTDAAGLFDGVLGNEMFGSGLFGSGLFDPAGAGVFGTGAGVLGAFGGGVTAEAGGGTLNSSAADIAFPGINVGVAAESGAAVVAPGRFRSVFFDGALLGALTEVEVVVLLGNGDGTFQAAVPIDDLVDEDSGGQPI